MKRTFLLFPVFFLLLIPVSFLAQQVQPADGTRLTVESIFSYRTKSLGPVRWTSDGSGYLALEPSPTKNDFVDIVRYDVTTGNRTILVSAEKLTPTGASTPLLVEEFDLS
jgi:dipeptidyl-peptidase 4